MAVSGPTIDEVIRRYLGELSEPERVAQQADLIRFGRWLGSEARLEALKAEDIERYQEQVEQSGADLARLEAVRAFLTSVHRQGITELNLGKYIKLRRVGVRKDRGPKAPPERARSRAGAPPPSAPAQPAQATVAEQLGDEITQITREGYEGLKQELDYLVNVKRNEIAQALYEARLDKDIRENAPFDAAKQHQGEVEARIRYLQRVIATAHIVEQASHGNRIGLGSAVVLRDLTHGDELSYTLVGSSEANPRVGRISIASPVGKALLDRLAGEEFEVQAPAGRIRYRIERIDG